VLAVKTLGGWQAARLSISVGVARPAVGLLPKNKHHAACDGLERQTRVAILTFEALFALLASEMVAHRGGKKPHQA
jgi:hypothetical protein